MKKRLFFPTMTICIVTLLSGISVKAQSNEKGKEALIGTTWRMVKNLIDGSKPDRILEFKKDLSFETRQSNGIRFNSGKYSLFNDSMFITIHDYSSIANCYNFKIQQDTLRFYGNYLASRGSSSDRKYNYSPEPVCEVWVKAPNQVKEKPTQDAGIKFCNDSLLSGALNKAKQQGKFLFVDCYTKWCGPCKYLASQIFPKEEVGDFYNQNFINASFDMETPEGVLIKEKYKVRGYPTLLYLDGNGEVVHSVIGAPYQTGMFIEIGKMALDSTKNMRGLRKKIDTGDRSARTLLQYFSTDRNTTDKQALLNEYFDKKSKEEKLSKDSWELFKHFNDVDQPQFKFFLKNRGEYEKRFGKKEVSDKITNCFDYNRRDSVKYQSLRAIDPTLFAKHKLSTEYQNAYFAFRRQPDDIGCWRKYLAKTKDFLAQDNIPPYEINEISWLIYENYKKFNDTDALTQAKAWSFKSYQTEPQSDMINDTYAHILFALGQKEEAVKSEEKALENGIKANSRSIKFYTDELERFRNALK